MEKSETTRIAFICTGNSARSQMAEGLARRLGKGNLVVQSAGTNPIGVAQQAVAVMAEIGIDISKQWSKRLSDLEGEIDYAITLCDYAERNCPFLPAKERLHWPFPDPHSLPAGTDSHDGWRRVRDALRVKIAEFLNAQGLLDEAESESS